MQATLYPYMLCTSLNNNNNNNKTTKQQQQNTKFPRRHLLPTTQRHYSPHFSEAWIVVPLDVRDGYLPRD
jgi:hypothetical protein